MKHKVSLMSEPVCARCGNCCYLQDKATGVQTDEPCPYLIKLSDGSTKCKVYFRTRLGRNIGRGNKCCYRKDVPYNYPGCPYNKDGQEFIQSVKE